MTPPPVTALPPGEGPAESLGEGGLHLWHASLARWRPCLDALQNLLPPPERDRVARMARPYGRSVAILSQGLLRLVLSNYVDEAPSAFDIDRDGKPRLRDGSISFNVSHSGDRLLIGVTGSAALGVDIERIDPGRNIVGIARRFFRTEEAAHIAANDDAGSQRAFQTVWTTKEAVTKADGRGLGLGLETVDASTAIGAEGWIPVELAGAEYWTCRVPSAPGYVAAVAVYGRRPDRVDAREAAPADDFASRLDALENSQSNP